MSFVICFHTCGLKFLGFVVAAGKLLNPLSVTKIQKDSSMCGGKYYKETIALLMTRNEVLRS